MKVLSSSTLWYPAYQKVFFFFALLPFMLLFSQLFFSLNDDVPLSPLFSFSSNFDGTSAIASSFLFSLYFLNEFLPITYFFAIIFALLLLSFFRKKI